MKIQGVDELRDFLKPPEGTQIIGKSSNGREVLVQCRRCGEVQRVRPEDVSDVSCCGEQDND